ncbi:DNA mismatch repair protein MutS [Candidatus Gracilibacteria bacterium]|nr:DNA mismatch repair protein MutS [Candidatus Gracilibacteria bacterium]
MQKILELINLLEDSIQEDPNQLITAGGIIKDGYDNEIDQYREVVNNGKNWLTSYQEKLIQSSGISKLRIKYTNASGYFIEVSKNQISNVPDDFIHKQSLVNASRFVTLELKEFETKLLEGESSLANLEYEHFLIVRDKVLDHFEDIKTLSYKAGYIDFGTGLSDIAYNNNYCRPEISNKYSINITGGRHPVIEEIEKDFISNDLSLNSKDYIHTITGPNMGGKSTFLRQNALIVLLAHCGSFVPAKMAQIPLVDKLFSRVGATDNLYLGQSTFMVEMQEVAHILNNSTKNSFVIIDEVGRGTSTYDGMSLAWAILKENHDSIKAKTLFATHYHELVDESKKLKGVENFSVAVGENQDNIVFLRKIIPGGMKKSYGIEVAKLAGVPQNVINSAQEMLRVLEKSNTSQLSLGELQGNTKVVIQKIQKKSLVEEELSSIDINSLTPMESLNILHKLINKL